MSMLEGKKNIAVFDFDGTITNKEEEFRKSLKLGRFNTTIEVNKQKKHQLTPEWRNQVKQAVKSNGRQTPKSRLDKNIDPQEIVNKYGGTGRISFSGDQKTVNEFITLSEDVGVTFDRKFNKYVKTKAIQIKYTEKGIHIFPTVELEE